jgi:hypothetical protein
MMIFRRLDNGFFLLISLVYLYALFRNFGSSLSLFLNLRVPPFSGKVISCFTKSVVVRDELEIRALIGSLVKKMVFANDIFTVDFIKNCW